MKKTLTARQAEVLDFIRQFIAEHKYPPTIREIAMNFGVNMNAIAQSLASIEKNGWITSAKIQLRRKSFCGAAHYSAALLFSDFFSLARL